MKDLVDRLFAAAKYSREIGRVNNAPLLDEAAIEIASLRHELAEAQRLTQNIVTHDNEAIQRLAAEMQTTRPEALPIDLDHTPGDSAELIEMLRRLFDKSADAHDGDYPAKVGHALMAVYAYGRRRASIPSPLARIPEEKT